MIGRCTVRALESAEADHAAAAMSGVEVELSAHGPSKSKHRIVELDLGPVCLRWGRVGAPVCVIGQVQPGVLLFSTSADCASPWMLNGQPMGWDRIARIAPGASYAMSIEQGTQWLAVRLDASWFQRRYRSALPASPEPVEVLVSSSHQNRALRVAFADAWRNLQSEDRIPEAGIRKRVRESVVAALGASVANASRMSPPHSRRTLALRHLHGLHRDSALGVHDLCDHLHLGERALRRLFAELYGISPAQYLRTRRLNQARRALQRGAGSHSVTEIAVALGFSDLGRFAAHYHSLFGELPSATLRGSRRRFEAGIT
jgi:AraC family ethanolamine operon transcriptional activator